MYHFILIGGLWPHMASYILVNVGLINGFSSVWRQAINWINVNWSLRNKSVKLKLKYKHFHWRKPIWKWCLQDVRHFVKSLNPLHAKFFRGNINIYLHFMSFLHTNKTQVVEIPHRVRQGTAYSTWSISWLLMSWQRKEPGHQ